MGDLKPILIDRHNNWEPSQSSVPTPSRTSEPSSSSSHPPENKLRKPSRQGSTRFNAQLNGMQIWYPDAAAVAQEMRKHDDAPPSKPRSDQRTRLEQAGIIQRQREADEEAARARQISESYAYIGHAPSAYTAPPMASSSSHSSSYNVPPLLPLESPTKNFEAVAEPNPPLNDDLYKRIADITLQRQQASSPFSLCVLHSFLRALILTNIITSSQSVPQPPITTTSEPLATIQYPQIMSQHQRTQGYTPSLQSMFTYPTAPPQSSLLFDQVPPMPSSSPYTDIIPAPSYPELPTAAFQPSAARPYMFGPRDRPNTPSAQTIARPPSPRSAPPPSHDHRRSPSNEVVAPRIATVSSSEKRELSSRGLRTVQFPREVLPRFLSIASVNTARNRETCGLLLGKLKHEKYVVTTLLVPRQHSTSDTCTMDEEELVLEFSEKRSLITLGWVNTS